MAETMTWVNLPQFQAQLAALGDAAAQALGDAALAGATVIQKHTQRNIRAQGLIDTSNYVNSWYTFPVSASGTQAEAATGTPVVYGPIHEFGGVIRPRNAVFLAIPVTKEMQGSPRQYDLAVAQTRGGQYVLVDRAGTVRYLLRQAVTIPARPHLRPAIDENTAEIEATVGGVLARAIQAAAR